MHLKEINTVKTNKIGNKLLIETEEEKESSKAISVKEYQVKVVSRKEIREFIEKWHYSKSINGLRTSYCFGLYYKETLIGVCMYGKLGMANVWKKYGDAENDVIELRRLALVDSAKRNSESYFIGKTLKWLRKNTEIKTVISYADTYYGHLGIIYQATNFNYIGKTKVGKKILYEGKLYQDTAIRTKYKGKLKPYAQRIKTALEKGEAKYINTPPKNIYQYNLVVDKRNLTC